jgi:hypothetical protein
MVTRRDFVKQSALAGAGLFLSSPLFSFDGSQNEKVVMGVVGTNSRGMYLAKMFAQLPGVEVGFICDVDENVLNRTITEIEKQTGKKPQGFRDVRKLLEVKELDAIAIAAPDHWHAPATLMALKAGKHVYVEKPCSHNPAEGEILVAASAKYNRLVRSHGGPQGRCDRSCILCEGLVLQRTENDWHWQSGSGAVSSGL